MTPTKEQIKKIKYSSAYLGCNASQKAILEIICKWEKIREADNGGH